LAFKSAKGMALLFKACHVEPIMRSVYKAWANCFAANA
jgi:hypothetical protein